MADSGSPATSTLHSKFLAWIDPLSTVNPPVVLVGAGLSYGLVPTADQYGAEIGPRTIDIQSSLGISASTIPVDATSLYQWADECVAELVSGGASHVDAKVRLARAMGLTTDPRFLAKFNIPSRGTTPRHRVLCRLAREGRIESFWSFNWDCWLESSLESVGIRSGLRSVPAMIAPHGWKLRYVVWFAGESSKTRTDTMLVFKAHGCVRALYESKGDFIVTESEMALALAEQPIERRNRMKSEVADRWLLAVGWSATESYVRELFAEQGEAGLLGEGITIVDLNCSQSGHVEVCASYGVDAAQAAVQVSGGGLGTTDDLLLWIQTLRGFGAIRAACFSYPGLQSVVDEHTALTPSHDHSSFRSSGLVSFVDNWLPAWLRICFLAKAQAHAHSHGNELEVLPTDERDAHIPWAPQADRRDDLMASVGLLSSLKEKYGSWDFEAFPGALWRPSTQEIVIPVPMWAMEADVSSLFLRSLLNHWLDQARIGSVKLLPLDAPAVVVSDPISRRVRIDRWKEAFAACFGRPLLSVASNYEEVDLNWLAAT